MKKSLLQKHLIEKHPAFEKEIRAYLKPFDSEIPKTAGIRNFFRDKDPQYHIHPANLNRVYR